MKGGWERADGLVHQFRQLLRRFSGQSNFEQICSIKVGPKNWPRKAGEQWALRPQGFDASGKLRAASLALRWGHHPPATCCCLFLWISGTRQQSRHVRSAAQVPRARRVRLLLQRPQAEEGGRSDQPEGAVALGRANQGAGAVVGHRCGYTWPPPKGACAQFRVPPTSTPCFQAPF